MPDLGDTIVAVASGPAPAPRGLIRISGPHTPALLAAELVPPVQAPGDGPPRAPADPLAPLAGFARFAHHPLAGLPCLLSTFRAPRSYTGDDAAELLLPANPHLLDRVVRRLCTHPGVREALPGEFSARAFLAGKLSLAQAEGVAAIIAARTAEELAAARGLLQGRSGQAYARWADELASLLALVEAGIDFVDQEDVVPIPPITLHHRLRSLTRELTSALGADRGAEAPDWRPTVALAGAPNAGKSTLFNALLGRPRAVASPIPGATRDVLREPLVLAGTGPAGARGGLAVTLIDLAGLDQLTTPTPSPTPAPATPQAADQASRGASPTDPLAAAAQAIAIATLRSADILLWCDPTGRFDPALRPPHREGAAVLCVRPKADQPVPTPLPAQVLSVCAVDGRGLAELRSALLDAAWGRSAPAAAQHSPPHEGSPGHLLPRHRRALLTALHYARQAELQVDPAADRLSRPELVASHLRHALDSAGELTGRVHPDEIVGRIFATFCIGK